MFMNRITVPKFFFTEIVFFFVSKTTHILLRLAVLKKMNIVKNKTWSLLLLLLCLTFSWSSTAQCPTATNNSYDQDDFPSILAGTTSFGAGDVICISSWPPAAFEPTGPGSDASGDTPGTNSIDIDGFTIPTGATIYITDNVTETVGFFGNLSGSSNPLCDEPWDAGSVIAVEDFSPTDPTLSVTGTTDCFGVFFADDYDDITINGNSIDVVCSVANTNGCLPGSPSQLTCAVTGVVGGLTDIDDRDGDGISNFCDLDDDNDGILDIDEGKETRFVSKGTSSQHIALKTTPYTVISEGKSISYTVALETTGSATTFSNEPSLFNFANIILADTGQTASATDNQRFDTFTSSNGQDIGTITLGITKGDFSSLNLYVMDTEYTSYTLTAYNGTTALSTSQWNIKTYEADGTSPASSTNTQTINSTNIHYAATNANQDFDVVRVRFDTETLKNADSIVISLDRKDSTINSGDGISFRVTGITSLDTDNDGIPDYQDTDSDNDGCPDAVEGAGNIASDDTDLTNLTGGSNGGSLQNLGAISDANGSPIYPSSGSTGFTQGTATDVTVPVSLTTADTSITGTVGVVIGDTFSISSNAVATAATTWAATPTFAPIYTGGTETDATVDLIYTWMFDDGTNTPSVVTPTASGTNNQTFTFPAATATSYGTYTATITHANNACIEETRSFIVVNPCLITGVVGGLTDIDDRDGDGISNFCDLDDDNDGILDIDEGCDAQLVNFLGIEQSGGNPLLEGDPSETFALAVGGEALGGGSITIDAPTLNGGGAGTVAEISSQPGTGGADILRFETNPNSVFGTQLSTTMSFSNSQIVDIFASNSTGASNLNSADQFTFTAVNAPSGFEWIILSSADATITISGSSLTIKGTSGFSNTTPFAEFKVISNLPIDGLDISYETVTPAGESLNSGRFSFNVYNCPGLDSDNDGIGDNLDLDSDNDGCPDAIEGAEAIVLNQLLANGSIDVANQGGVDTDGVPDAVSAGGQGQGIGSSIDDNVVVCCDASDSGYADADGDDVSDICDLDDDNDGILDTLEIGDCQLISDFSFENPTNLIIPTTVGANEFSDAFPGAEWLNANGTAGYFRNNYTPNDWNAQVLSNLPAPEGQGYAGFHSKFNSSTILTEVFQNNLIDDILIGKEYVIDFYAYIMSGTPGSFYANNFANPSSVTVLGIRKGTNPTINPSDYETVATLSAVSNVDVLGVSQVISNTTTWENYSISINPDYDYDRLLFTVTDFGSYVFFDELNVLCDVDTDNDGILDYLDLDSDGDGCPDAIEGGGDFDYSDLITSSMDGGNTDTGDGLYDATMPPLSDSPVVLNLGTSSNTDGTPNTDGNINTLNESQSIGTSQNAASNNCATDLELTKTVANTDGDPITTANVGQTIVYTVTVTNNSPYDIDVTGVSVKDILPTGLVLVSKAPTEGTYDETETDNSITIGNWDFRTAVLQQGDTEQLVITVTIGPTCSTLTNTAEITTFTVVGDTDPVLNPNGDIDSTPNSGN